MKIICGLRDSNQETCVNGRAYHPTPCERAGKAKKKRVVIEDIGWGGRV
jgi:hypothetical protein